MYYWVYVYVCGAHVWCTLYNVAKIHTYSKQTNKKTIFYNQGIDYLPLWRRYTLGHMHVTCILLELQKKTINFLNAL